jgi:hypothetical protein
MASSTKRASTLWRIGFALALAVGLGAATNRSGTVHASGVAYSTGDVIAGVGTGLIHHFSSTGTLKDTLDTGTGCSEDLGMAFDGSDNLYATAAFGTCYGSGRVVKFDNMGNLIGPFGSGYSYSTESISIDGAGHVYVGQPDGTHQVLKFDSAGNLLAAYSPAIEDRGTDWIDLAADQCTLFYTSEGFHIKRFNVCTNTQLPDFATLPAGTAYALRIRPNGEVMVATSSAVYRLDATGSVIQTYPLPLGESSFLFALNLDPDGTSFWTGGYDSGNVYRINISTGALMTSFNAGRVGCCLSGLAVVGEITVAQDNTPPTCALTGVIDGPPKQIQITVQDSDGGLKAPPDGIVVTSAVNATVSIPSYAAGTTSPVVVTATKIDQTQGSSVGLQITDVGGNVTTCDPAVLNVNRTTGKPGSMTAHGVARSEGKVHIYNGNPGVTTLRLNVNGQVFQIANLAAGQQATLDISAALAAGSNSVTLTAAGQPGGGVIVLIADR